MAVTRRYTSRDLEALPYKEGTRYEIIDGELHVTTMPHWGHQYASSRVAHALEDWNDETGLGFSAVAPGLVFADDQDVAPDLVWVSRARLPELLDASGHLRAAPELVVEVLSPGARNVRRDREQKLALYSRQGVREYWIVDWRRRTVDVYRADEGALGLAATLRHGDVLTSPMLPGFSCPVSRFWA